MAWKEGPVFQCPDPACGCEVIVMRGPKPEQGADQALTCCCSNTMQKKS